MTSFISYKTAAAAVIMAAATLTACDNIAPSDRLVEMDKVEVKRKVLLEDLTGQNCTNCPEAHAIIDQLNEQYGDNIIAVSVHGGGFGVPVERTNFTSNYVGLMTPEGAEYNDARQPAGWPTGLVNRTGGLSERDTWPALVRAALELDAPVGIDLSATLSADGTTIDIATVLHPSADIKAFYQLWIVEDGIVAFQRSGSKRVPDYVHNHVLRAAVNGVWGESVTLTEGIHTSMSHSIALRYNDHERWVAENLSVVAFVYNDEAGVLQAERVKLAVPGQPAE